MDRLNSTEQIVGTNWQKVPDRLLVFERLKGTISPFKKPRKPLTRPKARKKQKGEL
jgi:hypothetical protein